jgi:hypothetical protein
LTSTNVYCGKRSGIYSEKEGSVPKQICFLPLQLRYYHIEWLFTRHNRENMIPLLTILGEHYKMWAGTGGIIDDVHFTFSQLPLNK